MNHALFPLFAEGARLLERGECSLEHLRALPDDEVKAALRSYKGVGRANVTCASPVVWQMSRHDATSCSCHQISRQMSRHVFDTARLKIRANVERNIATSSPRASASGRGGP